MKNKNLFIFAMLFFGITSAFAGLGSVNPTSSTHDVNTLSKVNDITFTWTPSEVTDTGGVDYELSGYAYVFDTSPDTNVTLSNKNGDTQNTSIPMNNVDDGVNYYFHIAPYGTADGSNIDDAYWNTETFGPIKIDTTAPTLNAISSSSGAYGSKVITLGATDANMDGLKIYYTTDGTDVNSINGTEYSTAFTIYANTDFKIKAKDTAGNWSDQMVPSTVNVSYIGNVPSISGVDPDSIVATNDSGGATVTTA
ncbi:MAG: chitobiase/beta-hexosaminidase C-terminal domain-containing protein, partial [Arcobacteraceae bacterium]|nr:chitobiase/beta-hexosaminidase C-terminal domain-containing protein [Arcobacteraceae bacterium]